MDATIHDLNASPISELSALGAAVELPSKSSNLAYAGQPSVLVPLSDALPDRRRHTVQYRVATRDEHTTSRSPCSTLNTFVYFTQTV